MFAQKGRAYDAIPPTRTALLKHTNRAAYQAGHCEAKRLHHAQISLHQGIEDGFSKRESGSLSGRRFQMWPSRAKSYFVVGASVGVEEVFPVLERPWSALLFEAVMTNTTAECCKVQYQI